MFRLMTNIPQLGEIHLSKGTTTIGRHGDNTIVIDDERASRFHCSIETNASGKAVIRDLGSRNGTRLNEHPVTQAELTEGDVIRVGGHVFRVIAMENDHSRPARGAGKSAAADAAARGQGWAGAIAGKIDALVDQDAGSGEAKLVLIGADGAASPALNSSADGSVAVRLLFRLAAAARATDVHFEPKRDAFLVRMRVDGGMVQVAELPSQVGVLAMRLIKTACQLKEAGRDALLDGHFSLEHGGRRVDCRASFTPTVHGQKLVVRLLDPYGSPQSLESLQLPAFLYERIKKVCEQDTGLLLVCGPTGSGKTTTLYNALRSIDRERRNVVTLEDPVEYTIEGTTQIPVAEKVRFDEVLRSVLRQDPDVILVGEVRDRETAVTAMRAAMTGHVVFTTVHARDTIGSIFRIIDLGVEPYLVANSLDVVIAQRLVRVLCAHCKRAVRVAPGQAARIGRFLEGKHETYAATGCPRCLRTGYHGRRGIFELLDFSGNDALRDIVLTDPSIQKMKRLIEQGVFTSLLQSGWRLAARGVTSLDEVERVIGSG